MSLADLIPGFTAGKAAAAGAAAVALFAAGAMADRFAPLVGAQHQIDGLNKAVGGYVVRMQADAAQMRADADAIRARDKLLGATQGTAADETTQDAGRCAVQARTAYASGLAYGRSHAGQLATPQPGGPAGPGPDPAGGVRGNLADLWRAGRFVPAADPGGR